MTIHAQNTSFRNRTVGDIAATMPGATSVFREFRLDFCCGGDVPLTEAAGKRGVDPAEIEQKLLNIDGTASTDIPKQTGKLVQYIANRYNVTHRHELPELLRLARKVEAVHSKHPDAPHGLANALEAIRRSLEEHMQKEEAVLYPLMQRGPKSAYEAPFTLMREEHEDQTRQLRQLEIITNNFQVPEGACRSWQALYTGTAKFVDDVLQHIYLENNVLFPRFEMQ